MKSKQPSRACKQPKLATDPDETIQSFHLFKAVLSKFLKKTQKIIKSVEPTTRIALATTRKHKKKKTRHATQQNFNSVVVLPERPSELIQEKPSTQITLPHWAGKLLF